MGFPRKAGETNYYSSLNRKTYGVLQQQIPCKHGHITIKPKQKSTQYRAQGKKLC